MPRLYKPDPRGKTYKKYDESLIQQAVEEYRKSKVSLKIVAEKYNIDKSVLYRHSTRTMRKQGGQTIFSEEEEKNMIKYINVCAEWGYPLDSVDLRYLVKSYLDKQGRTVLKFKNNFPGPDFVASFLKRHKDIISQRNCQNIKKNRAAVSPDSIRAYFRELEVSLANIEPCNIVNYDETNLTDDPGRKKILTKRGTKYPERVMNHSKVSTSVMIAASAAGELLPPYVVYKAQNLYDTWTENGPPGTRYNRSASGWFDATIFEDWIKSTALPYFRGKEGKKCLIGDNLSSHLSLDVIKLCHEENITFVFLPANSTHLTQPLDVAFFRPMKIAWRNILLKWKKTDGKTQASVPKGCFPKLLKKLIIDLNQNAKDNILAGFRKTGIWPINENQVLGRLPEENNNENKEDAVEKSVLDILKEMRYGTMNVTESKRKRKLDVIPGRSVGTETEEYVDTEEDNLGNTKKIKTAETTTTTCVETKKGKGRGKKTKRRDQYMNGTEEGKKEVADTETMPRIEVADTEIMTRIEVADIETMPVVFEDDYVIRGRS